MRSPCSLTNISRTMFWHYWILFKLLLTVLATIILLLHMPMVSYMAGIAAETNSAHLGGRPGKLLHAGGGLLMLLVTTTLSVYKPRGHDPIRVAQAARVAATVT